MPLSTGHEIQVRLLHLALFKLVLGPEGRARQSDPCRACRRSIDSATPESAFLACAPDVPW
eukprot:15460181-Alexandrium_andersonii.AAC.1